MFKSSIAMALTLATGVAVPAQAATLSATAANLVAVFASAKAGDTIKVTGTIGSTVLQNRSFTSTVTIDATNAVFSDTLTLKNLSKVTFVGGTFGSTTAAMRTGRAVGLYNSNNVIFSKPKFIGNSIGAAVGLTVAGSTNIGISAGHFTGSKLGIGITSSSDVRISSSRFIGMTSDGVNIADSHRVTATANLCTDTVPSAMAHPDCIQLWSIAGNAPQSDIMLSKNTVYGATQGLTSFNSADGGGIRISMIDNIITTSYPQGIACGECSDSVFTGNVLSTLPGAQWRTSMNIVGGTNNIIANNIINPKPAATAKMMADFSAEDSYDPSEMFYEALPDFVLEDLAYLSELGFYDSPSLTMELGARSFESAAAAVPEPGVWGQLIFGFALTGLAVRRRRRVPAHA